MKLSKMTSYKVYCSNWDKIYSFQLINIICRSLVMILIILSTGGTSKANWQWLNPKPQGFTLNSVYFATNLIGYAVGDSGTILKTTDGGVNWTIQTWGGTSYSVYNLMSISCPVDANTCFVVGSSGKRLKTTDGGNTWTELTSASRNLNFITCPIDANTCYAVGDNGIIVKTSDGGASWTIQDSGTVAVLYSVECPVDVTTCFTVGSFGNVRKTTNGGSTAWSEVTSGTANHLYSIDCSDVNNCYISGQGGILRRTDNGGATWSSLASGIIQDLYSVLCPVNATTCYAAGKEGKIIKTTNSGTGWNQQTSGNAFFKLTSVSCPEDVNTCYSIGQGGFIIKTVNGGVTWSEISSGTTYNDNMSMTCPTGTNNCYITRVNDGNQKGIYKTSDGGISWALKYSDVNNTFKRLSCPVDHLTCFAAGSDTNDFGKILRTIDGGASWSVVYTKADANMSFDSIHCPVDAKVCYAAGGNGVVVKTIDGGNSWVELFSGIDWGWLTTIHCTDSNTCLVGTTSNMRSTMDGGSTWTTQSPIGVYKIDCLDQHTCYAITTNAGAGSKIYKTTTGGSVWTEKYYNLNSSLYAFHCPVNEIACYAGGNIFNNATIIGTSNGGEMWSEEYIINNNNVRDLYCTKSDNCYIVGNTGAILQEGSGNSETASPAITDNQPDDDTIRIVNNGVYDIDISDSGGSGLNQFQIRACSTNTNCGDIKDWTVVKRRIGENSYTADWSLPSAVWNALPNGTSYISVRVFDNAGNLQESGPLFYVKRQYDCAVTNNNDSGAGSLRECINYSNSHAGTDLITFSIANSIISPSTQLPALNDLTGATTIDGTGNNIILTGPGMNGILISSSNNMIKGITFKNFTYGVTISVGGNNSVKNSIFNNNSYGIRITGGATNNVIGGSKGVDTNYIYNNNGSQVIIDSANQNNVSGNVIGLNPLTNTCDNSGSGITIQNSSELNMIGGNSQIEGNIIGCATFGNGLFINTNQAVNNTIKNNLIGVNIDGVTPISNKVGIKLGLSDNSSDMPNNTIISNNVISGNTQEGVLIFADNTTLASNIIGLSKDGNSSLSVMQTVGILKNSGTGTIIGGDTESDGNTISGNIIGISIFNYYLDLNTRIKFNKIGTDKNGTIQFGNQNAGISVSASGGFPTSNGLEISNNVISGNQGYGIYIGSAIYNTQIIKNYIGTDKFGINSIGNSFSGILLATSTSSSNSSIGSDSMNDQNVIMYNQSGIVIPTTLSDLSIGINKYANNVQLGIDTYIPAGSLGTVDSTGQPFISVTEDANSKYNIIGHTCNNCRVYLYGADDYTQSISANQTGYGEGAAFLAILQADNGGNFATSGLSIENSNWITTAIIDTATRTKEFTKNFDITPPSNIDSVEFMYDLNTNEITASWSGAADPHSGIARYWYSIGSTEGASDVLGWTPNESTAGYATTAISLTNGLPYYLTVKAENGSGLQSATSSGYIQFTSLSFAGVEGILGCGSGCLQPYWVPATGTETVQDYRVYLSTTNNFAPEPANWVKDIPANQISTMLTGLSDGTTYYVKVRVRSTLGTENVYTVEKSRVCGTSRASDFTTALTPMPEQTFGNSYYTKWQATGFDAVSSLVETGNAGDINGDGINDIMVGDPIATPAGINDAGAVYIYSGYDGSLIYEKYGSLDNTNLGSNGIDSNSGLSGHGDMNGDGKSEFAIAEGLGTNSSRIFIFDGATGNMIYSKLGRYSAIIGDINHDSRADFIVGNPKDSPGSILYAGNVTVYSGADGSILHQINGSSMGDEYGYNVSSAGDVNADNCPDFMFMNWYHSIFVYDGETGNIVFEKVLSDTNPVTYKSIATAGDVNGDGLDDIILGDSCAGVSCAGAAFILSGLDGSVLFQINGTNAVDRLGKSVSTSGDLNGDGKSEFMVGVPNGDVQPRSVRIYDGLTGNIFAQIDSSATDFANNNFGYAISSLGDINGDALGDFVVGGYGRAFVFVSDFSNPTITDNQTGDETWRTANPGAIYDVDFNDIGSGLNNAQYSIWSEANMSGTQVIGWTDIATSINSMNYTANWAADFTLLAEGTNYVSIRAFDNIGRVSLLATDSFYIKKDTTGPSSIATINDGAGSDIDYSTDTMQLSANWATATDDLSGVKYWYCIGTTAGTCDILPWADNGTSNAMTHTGLFLSGGATYYISVKAVNGAGLESAVKTTDGILIPVADAPISEVTTPVDGAYLDALARIDGISSDMSSLGLLKVEVSIKRTSDTKYWNSASWADAQAWLTASATETWYLETGLPAWADGQQYQIQARATDNAGHVESPAPGSVFTFDIQAPTVAITTPAVNASISGVVNVTGTVSDTTLTQWRLYYGAGTAPSAWKQIAQGANQISSGTISAWNTTTLSGTYTLKLTATDGFGRTTQTSTIVLLTNSSDITGTVPKLKWVMLSAPMQPVAAEPTRMFGSGEYKLFRWDPTAADDPYLSKYRYPVALSVGQGFWIRSYDRDLSYTYTGSVNDTTQDYVVSMKAGWNQIGTPFNRDYPWGQVQVRHLGGTYDLATAASMGLISSTLHSYDSNANTWVGNDVTMMMKAQTGYAVQAFTDVELVFGPGAGMPGGMARVARSVYDYHIKLSATAQESADTDNYFGAKNAASDEYDANDAQEPPKVPEGKYTTLYFMNEQWARHAGRYSKDIRATAKTAGDKVSWPFNVETNEIGQTVTLTWDNTALPTDRYSFTLVDLGAGQRIDMAVQNSYTYTATGGDVSTARFIIEVVKLTSSTIVTASYSLKPGWNLISVPLEPEVTNALTLLGGALPLFNVYQYYDGQFYENDKADIQAGFGYWIYVENNAQIDLTGMPAAPQVRVPLKPGWNVIGNPYQTDLPWDDSITLECNEQNMPLSQAVQTNAIDLNRYQFDSVSYTQVEQSAPLQPWKGYFIKASQSCDLILSQ